MLGQVNWDSYCLFDCRIAPKLLSKEKISLSECFCFKLYFLKSCYVLGIMFFFIKMYFLKYWVFCVSSCAFWNIVVFWYLFYLFDYFSLVYLTFCCAFSEGYVLQNHLCLKKKYNTYRWVRIIVFFSVFFRFFCCFPQFIHILISALLLSSREINQNTLFFLCVTDLFCSGTKARLKGAFSNPFSFNYVHVMYWLRATLHLTSLIWWQIRVTSISHVRKCNGHTPSSLFGPHWYKMTIRH